MRIITYVCVFLVKIDHIHRYALKSHISDILLFRISIWNVNKENEGIGSEVPDDKYKLFAF